MITREEREVIDRFWKGLPVKDATADLYIAISEEDIAKAVRLDPTRCVNSQACKRMYGSKAVVFFKTIAYVDLLNTRGKRVVRRFEVNKTARELIEKFDTGKPIFECGFTLLAVGSGRRLGDSRKYKQHTKRYTENHRKRILAGTVRKRKRMVYIDGAGNTKADAQGIRNGTGLVQFSHNKD